jgi:hypothetical protein
MSPDAADVWAEFYGSNRDTLEAREATTYVPLPVSLELTPDYGGALFVKQMTRAGLTEVDAQRQAFFNADLLVRDIEARAVERQLSAILEVNSELLGNWEDAVADPATAPNAAEYGPSARKLFSVVMRRTQSVKPPAELPLRSVHTRGLMHRIVEDGRAGWVHDWRDVARDHVKRSASTVEGSRQEIQASTKVEDSEGRV